MKKQKKKASVLRCIRIPRDIDRKITQICEKQGLNYSRCVRMFISQGIETDKKQAEGGNGGNVAGDVWAWANNQNRTA